MHFLWLMCRCLSSESVKDLIVNPVTISSNASISEAVKLMAEKNDTKIVRFFFQHIS